MVRKESRSGKVYLLQKLYDYYSQPLNLEKDERLSGLGGWLFLLGVVVAYDCYAIKTQKAETLTRSFWRLTEKPMQGVLPLAAWFVITGHLVLEKNIRKKKFGIIHTKD
jgi:hypothetical protein